MRDYVHDPLNLREIYNAAPRIVRLARQNQRKEEPEPKQTGPVLTLEQYLDYV